MTTPGVGASQHHHGPNPLLGRPGGPLAAGAVVASPDSLKAFMEEQVTEKGYGTSSEYVRELIRRDQERQHLRTLLLDGAQSPPTRPADAAYFDDLRDRIRMHID